MRTTKEQREGWIAWVVNRDAQQGAEDVCADLDDALAQLDAQKDLADKLAALQKICDAKDEALKEIIARYSGSYGTPCRGCERPYSDGRHESSCVVSIAHEALRK